MKKLEQYLGSNYSDKCQLVIMTETPSTFPDPEMPTIISDTGVDIPKTYTAMTYLKKKNIDKAIRKTMRKKYVY